ncbi:hypothetical protein ACWDT6_13735 [Nocardia grenadensis]|uniref:hypothetical protein n=1 Tax=Nocardia grenadensis TaxID=931537 RepID=UPI003D7351EF
MVYTAELLSEVPGTLMDLVIGELPELNDEMTRTRGDAAIRAGEELEVIAAQCDSCAQRTAGAITGETGKVFDESDRGMVECVRAQAAVLKDLGYQCHAAADAAAQTRHLIIVTAIALGAQLAWDALLFFQGGGYKALADRAAAEQTMRAAVAQLVRTTAEQGAAAAARRAAFREAAQQAGKAAGIGGLFGGATGVAAQIWDIASGVREQFDTRALVELTAASALGGVAGAAVGRRLAPGLLKRLSRAADAGVFSRLAAHLGGTLLLGSAGGLAGGAASTIPSLIIHRDEYSSLGEMFAVVRDNAIGGFAGGFVEAAGAAVRVHKTGRDALRGFDTGSGPDSPIRVPDLSERPPILGPEPTPRLPESAPRSRTELEGPAISADAEARSRPPVQEADSTRDDPDTTTRRPSDSGLPRATGESGPIRTADDFQTPQSRSDTTVPGDAPARSAPDTDSTDAPVISHGSAEPTTPDTSAPRPPGGRPDTVFRPPSAETPTRTPWTGDRYVPAGPRPADITPSPWNRPGDPASTNPNPPKQLPEGASAVSATPDTAPPAPRDAGLHRPEAEIGRAGHRIDTSGAPESARYDDPGLDTSDRRADPTDEEHVDKRTGKERSDDDPAEDPDIAVDGLEDSGPQEWRPSAEIRREIVSRVRALQKEGMEEVLADPARAREVIERLGQRFVDEDIALINQARVEMPLSQLFPPEQIAYMRYSIERSIASGCVQFKIGESALSLMLRHPEQVRESLTASYETEPPAYAASWLDDNYVMHAQDGYPRSGGQHAFLQAAVHYLNAGWGALDPVWRDIAAIKDERSADRNPLLDAIPPEQRAELDLPAHFVDDGVPAAAPIDKSVLSAATNMTSVQQVMRGFLDSLGEHAERISGTAWADIQHAVIQSPQKLSVMAGVTFTTLGEFTEPRRPPRFDIKFDDETGHINSITVTGEAKNARANSRPGFCPGFQSLRPSGIQETSTARQMESVQEVLDGAPNRSVSGSNTLMQFGSVLLPLLARDYPELRLTGPTIIDRLIEQRGQNPRDT